MHNDELEIVKVLYRGADILILDEPTAVLTPQETEKLFAVMKKMRDDGKAVVIITHKLNEVMEVADRVAVLRKGHFIGDMLIEDTNPQEMTNMMVGHQVSLNIDRPEPVNVKPRLEVKNLTVVDNDGVTKLDNVMFTANAGEILGIGGISGLIGTFLYENSCAAAGTEPNKLLCLVIALVCAIAASVISGLIYSVLTITLRANQNVTGLTLTIFGGGFANFFGGTLNKLAGGVGQVRVTATASVFGANLHNSLQLGSFGELFLSYGFNVIKYKYICTCIGAAISGLGGLFFVMDYTSGTWSSDGGLESLGWLAVALVIFAIWGGYLFGLLSGAYFYIGGLNRSSQEIFKMLPYVVTILIIVIVSVKKNRDNLGPAALGSSYFREDR